MKPPIRSIFEEAAIALLLILALFTGAVAFNPAAEYYQGGDGAMLPDPRVTPGATIPGINQANIQHNICVAGYTASARPPSSFTNRLKAQQMKLYGLNGDPSEYEEDHLISLELGGAPRDPKNLWPQPWEPPGAHQKDQVENWLHKQVCAGEMPLTEAQHLIATNWYAAYQQMLHDRFYDVRVKPQ